jgi:tRNA splicing ligase
MEQKNNTGAIFKNDYKKTDSQPDYKGKAVIDGVQKEVALWLNESKDGVKYFGATFSKPYQAEVEAGGNEDAKYDAKIAEGADDLPF